ncbi:uncharacterized protein K452DRAFT_310599 [Aplosporella prunicola CBS 121167]|uniref:Methyltransferase domain-containing protein n=1 Tax=Aplosporella prunicola CBS 121167 TaxID=1176127 RepID=A0A6A6B8K9_9PEZI|nr:uncharacterized protein K452DRAFT_310599 [Aplosporella prunicola CBS 121167]KAF2139693.1 hypothetical protein K452DRAFT_310599 [Aplosporella prunicola CBS 121167]
MVLPLPPLLPAPTHHADCCLSLSAPLLHALAQHLPKTGAVLSVGSGSGLLEAHLAARLGRPVHGADVANANLSDAAALNRYLPDECAWPVHGTWDLCPLAQHAPAWLFVYPREPALVRRYFDVFAARPADPVRVVVWLGPRADWPDYEAVLAGRKHWSVHVIEGAGLVPYEMIVVVRRNAGV